MLARTLRTSCTLLYRMMNPEPETTEHELEARGRSAAERAYDYVKERLLDGRFAGGTLLSENEIAQRLGLSRTPVRQAFVQLEGEELLELYPKRGALVVPITPSEAEDVLEARLLIEQHCVRRAAVAGGPVLIEELRETIAAQERALDRGSGFAWADRQFHLAIVVGRRQQAADPPVRRAARPPPADRRDDDRARPDPDRALHRRAPRDRRGARARRRRRRVRPHRRPPPQRARAGAPAVATGTAPARHHGERGCPSTSRATATPTRTRSRPRSATRSCAAAWTPANEYVPVRLGDAQRPDALGARARRRARARAAPARAAARARRHALATSRWRRTHEPVREVGLTMAEEDVDLVPIVDDGGVLDRRDDRARARPPLHPRVARAPRAWTRRPRSGEIARVLEGELLVGEPSDEVNGRVLSWPWRWSRCRSASAPATSWWSATAPDAQRGRSRSASR